MRKSTYLFEVMDRKGKMLHRCKRRCNNIGAHALAGDLLSAAPEAAAVYGFEVHGMQVHVAYRR